MTAPSHLTWARAHLGQHEQGGANQGPIVERSIALWTGREAGAWAAWCAGFVSTALVAGGAERALELGTLGAEQLHTNMRPYWLQPDELPQAGDVVWMRRSGGSGWHVGLVADTFGAPDLAQIRTIEGNADNAVRSKVYAGREAGVIGYARPRALGACGALPPQCGRPMQPCVQPAWHEGACDAPRPLAPDLALGMRAAPVGHPKQGRALSFLRAGRPIEDIARAFGTTPECWTLLERGALWVTPETFARLCRGLL